MLSYSDFKVFKALSSKQVGNGNVSQTVAATELNLVSFERATKLVLF